MSTEYTRDPYLNRAYNEDIPEWMFLNQQEEDRYLFEIVIPEESHTLDLFGQRIEPKLHITLNTEEN